MAEAYRVVFGKYGDALFVAAAGNEAMDLDASWGARIPCMVAARNLICVGATDERDSLVWSSNYGNVSVDMVAPGVRMRVPALNDAYTLASGPSYATPLVATTAAMMWSACPTLTLAVLKDTLMASGDLVVSTHTVLHRRLNARRALSTARELCS